MHSQNLHLLYNNYFFIIIIKSEKAKSLASREDIFRGSLGAGQGSSFLQYISPIVAVWKNHKGHFFIPSWSQQKCGGPCTWLADLFLWMTVANHPVGYTDTKTVKSLFIIKVNVLNWKQNIKNWSLHSKCLWEIAPFYFYDFEQKISYYLRI